MRENRLYGSEGGEAERPFLPLSHTGLAGRDAAVVSSRRLTVTVRFSVRRANVV